MYIIIKHIITLFPAHTKQSLGTTGRRQQTTVKQTHGD